MKQSTFALTLFAILLIGCHNQSNDEHAHEHDGSAPLSYTLYSDHLELFVEFKPLVVGSKSNFATHLTILGELFTPLKEGKVTVSLVVGESVIRNSSDLPNSPGIYRLALVPKTAGKGQLIFDVQTATYTDRIIIPDVEIFTNQDSVDAKLVGASFSSNDISYLKEQAWKVDFATVPVEKSSFSEVIKANGRFMAAPGDEEVVSAGASGIVRFWGSQVILGAPVSPKSAMFMIQGGNIAENNLDASYEEAKSNLEKTKADYERNKTLAADRIVSDALLAQSKNDFDKAQADFSAISKNYSNEGQSVYSSIDGTVRSILVSNGQFVQSGTPLAIVASNKRLLLQTELSPLYFDKLPLISSANFKVFGSEQVFDTRKLDGKLISRASSTVPNTGQIPVSFELKNDGSLILGSTVEIYLRTIYIPDALLVPLSALVEEQGVYFVYVQTGGELFQKREVRLGGNDGVMVHLLSGIKEGERVVSKGAFQIKLSTASGQLPAHGHEH